MMQRNVDYADYAAEWTSTNDMKFNAEKKRNPVELFFSFAVLQAKFPPIVINGQAITAQVKSAKLLAWGDHPCRYQVGPPRICNAQQVQPASDHAVFPQEEWYGPQGASKRLQIHHPSHP